MSIFDTIADGISSLFDDGVSALTNAGSSLTSGSASSGWFGNDTSDSSFLNTVGKNAVKGFGALENSKEKTLGKDEQNYKFLERNVRMAQLTPDPDSNQAPVHLRGAMSGAQNYSADASDIQNYWNQTLKGLVINGR